MSTPLSTQSNVSPPVTAETSNSSLNLNSARISPQVKQVNKSNNIIEPPPALDSGFVLPALHSWPPFFTKQPHPPTWSVQLQAWQDLILSWARYHSVFRLDITQDALKSSEAAVIWSGRPLGRPRRVSIDFAQEIIDSMVQAGLAFYESPTSTSSVFLLWRSVDEWARLIYEFAKENGLINSIMTLNELVSTGDLAHTTPFYRLPDPILRKSLNVLIRQNRAQVFKGSSQDGDGVKFFHGS